MNKIFEFNGDVFVIPNRIGAVGKLPEYTKRRVHKLAEINKTPVGPEDVLVELWFTGEASENLVDHGAMFGDEYRRATCGLVPAKLLIGLREGEILKIDLPCGGDDIISCKVKAAQKKSRYRMYNNFEDAVNFCLR